MATALSGPTPKHLWIVGILSLLWNCFGAYDYTMSHMGGLAYFEQMGKSPLLPSSESELALLLDVHLIEKALSELSYELDTRPHWVELPLRGLLGILESES